MSLTRHEILSAIGHLFLIIGVAGMVLVIAMTLTGCEIDNDTFPPILPETGTCIPQPVPEAVVLNALATPDGVGTVRAIDSTPGAIKWEWTLPGCSPDRSARATFSTTCPLGTLNWRLTVTDINCSSFTSDTLVVD